MATVPEGNFAGCLAGRLGRHSYLIDSATGLTIEPAEVPGLVAGYGAAFHAAGLRPADRVLLASPLSPLSCLAYLGAMYAGLVVAPVEERSLAASGKSLIEATGAKAIWTEQKAVFEWLHQMPALISLHGDLTGGKPQPMKPVPRRDSDLAALMATSGSTGVPRFVMVTHGNLRANTEAIARSQGLREDERAMLILPISYCFGASVMHSHLYQGGGIVFDRRFMFPDKVLQAMAQYGCTTFAGVPTAYNVLAERSKIRGMSLPSLRRMLQAGGALARPVMEEIRRAVPNAQFYVMYGQTEATARISCLEPSRLDDKAGSAGKPLDNLIVRIVNEQGEELQTGQTGEIWVKGPSVCAGYLNDLAEAELVFRDGWLRTRDVGCLDAEGFLWVQGRLGAFVKMRGLRVSFAEVETKVASIPGVMECAAQAVPHPEAGEALVLLMVPRAGAQPVWEEMRRHLPAHWMFDSVRFVTELPKTANGKLARRALAEQLKSAHGTA
jgi:acyl-CoA synthetase (AMP-forming)/AMP-acid ligase II